MNIARPLGLVSVLLLAACSQRFTVPPEQAQFDETVLELQKRYRVAESSRNEIKIAEVERAARDAMELKAPLIGWRGRVTNVSTLMGQRWATVDGGKIEYRVYAHSEAAKDQIAKLGAGDIISFSGFAEIEMSFTMSGAIKSPSYLVRASSLERVWEF